MLEQYFTYCLCIQKHPLDLDPPEFLLCFVSPKIKFISDEWLIPIHRK